MRNQNELPASLRARAATRRTPIGVCLVSLAETEIGFPSSLLVTEGRRGQTLSGWPTNGSAAMRET